MAETLSVQIALEGGKEIESQLEDIGAAGKKAFNDISTAAANVGGFDNLDPGEATRKLEELGITGEASINKIIAAVKKASVVETLVNGVKAVANAFDSMGTAIEKSITIMAKHAAASAGLGRAGVAAVTTMIASFGQFATVAAAAVVAVGAWVLALVKSTEELNRLSAAAIQAGTSVEALSKAENIFKAIGLSSEDAAKGVKSFDDALALKNVKEARANLDEYGRSASTTANWLDILTQASKRTDEAGDLARQKLQELGRLKIDTGVADELNRIGQSAQSLPDKLLATIGVLEKMKDPVERNQLIFAQFGTEIGTKLVQALDAGGVKLDDIKAKLPALIAQTQAQAVAAEKLTLAWNGLKETLLGTQSPKGLEDTAIALNAIRAVVDYLRTVPALDFLGNTIREFQTIGDLFNSFISAAQTAVSTVSQFFSQLPGQIAGYFAGFGSNLWDGIVQGAATAWQTVIDWINKAIDAAKAFLGMGGGQAAAAGGGGIGSAASGGLIGGTGTGTSDSNLAWVSRGEHIMPARAVAQPGVLAFLEALRRTGGDLHGLLNGMGRFALGGLVSAPTFAGGGLNGMSHVTIAFPGLPPIGGLRASSSVVDELHRAAAMAQVRSGGRKPSRYF